MKKSFNIITLGLLFTTTTVFGFGIQNNSSHEVTVGWRKVGEERANFYGKIEKVSIDRGYWESKTLSPKSSVEVKTPQGAGFFDIVVCLNKAKPPFENFQQSQSWAWLSDVRGVSVFDTPTSNYLSSNCVSFSTDFYVPQKKIN